MEPKIKITTKKGTVFNSMQDYRKASASAGVPLDDMSDDQIVEQFSKSAKEGEAPAITVQYGATDQPPLNAKSPAALPSAVIKQVQGRGSKLGDTTAGVLGPVGEKISNIVSGAGSSVLSTATGAMRLFGIDPSKTPVPTSYSFGGQVSGIPVGGSMAPIIGTPLSKKPEEKPQEMTIGELEKKLEPTTPEGKAAAFATDVYTFGKARGALGAIGAAGKAKLPVKVAAAVEGPKIQFALDKAANFGLSLLQEYGKTGDTDTAADAATTGSIIDLGLSGIGYGIKSLYKKYGQEYVKQKALKWANEAVPFLENVKRDVQQDIEYKRQLAARMLYTASDFTERGAKAITDRFTSVVKSMKNASDKSDEMLEELHRLNLIPESELRQVNYGSEITKALSEVKNKQIDPAVIQKIENIESRINSLLPKKPKLDSSGNKIPVMTPKVDPKTGKAVIGPNGQPQLEQAVDQYGEPLFEVTDELDNLTFKQAEKFKERINSTLKGFYDTGILSTEDKIDKQVKLEYADAVRRAQKTAFDKIKQIKDLVTPKIPAKSPAKDMRPWEVPIPGQSKPVAYSEAANIAMQDADLSKIAWEARRAIEPQPNKSAYNEMSAAVGLAQFMHGSILTPSQLATAWKMSKTQEKSSRRALWAQRSAQDLRSGLPARLQPFTKIPPSISGKAAAIMARPELTTEPTPSAQQLLEEKEVRPLPKDYFQQGLSK